MRKLAVLICLLAILLTLSSAASADSPIGDTIVVSGSLSDPGTVTVIGRNRILIKGMQATGTVLTSDLFEGADFSIDDEDAIIDLGTLEGVNWGRITITTDEGEVHIRFAGRTFDLDPVTMEGSVAGQFRLVGATGVFTGMQGRGRYSGTAAFLFTLTFTGWFHKPPQ